MSPKTIDKLLKYGMPVLLVFLSFFLGRYSNNKQKTNEVLNEKLKNDIATTIINQLKPVIDEKMNEKEFQAFKIDHDKQYEKDLTEIKTQAGERYNMLLVAIDKNSIKIDNSNKKIDNNFNKVIEAQNNIYQILIKK